MFNDTSHARILVPDLTGGAIPIEMRSSNRWLNWIAPSLKPDDPSRYDKVPVGAKGYPVNAHDPKNHRSFQQVVDSFRRVHGDLQNKEAFRFEELVRTDGKPNLIAGIAFDLPNEIQPWAVDEDGQELYLAGLDWDRVIKDGMLSEQVRADVRGLKHLYVERSPSGTGLRAFALTREPVPAFNKCGFETYSQGRYLTMTGHGKGALQVVSMDSILSLQRQYGKSTAIAVTKPRLPAAVRLSINSDVLASDQTTSPPPPLEDLLAAIPASVDQGCGRETWIRVIWAARSGYGNDEGIRQALINWSMSSPVDFDERAFDNVWHSPERDDGVSIGTLIHIAQQHGWTRPASPDGDPSAVPNLATMLTAEHTASADQWEEPIPLRPALPAVTPFSPELLPEQIRPWVLDIAHRMQCPPDFPAVGAMVALSSLIGARVSIHPKAKDDWQVIPNLWGMIIGRPGIMKSPALGQALAPLSRLEAAENERWLQAREAWDLDKQLAELAEEAATKEAKKAVAKDLQAAKRHLQSLRELNLPAEPVLRRYLVNDATVEKLGEILQATPDGLLVYRDELYGLLCGLDKQGQEGSRAFYLQAYDGNEGYTFDRIGRGTLRIERVCFSLLGGTQPGRVEDYVRGALAGGSGDDGLLQRFGLAVWPDASSQYEYVDQWPDTPARQRVNALFDRLDSLHSDQETPQRVYRYSPQAQERYAQWTAAFETEIRHPDMHPALASHFAKYRKLVPALSLIFTLIDRPDSEHVVDTPELERALKWAAYLRSHAQRLYACAVHPVGSTAIHLLDKLKAGSLSTEAGSRPRYFTPRVIAQKNWTGLKTVKEVEEAADILVDHGWLRAQTVQVVGGGRPSVRYHLHPSIG